MEPIGTTGNGDNKPEMVSSPDSSDAPPPQLPTPDIMPDSYTYEDKCIKWGEGADGNTMYKRLTDNYPKYEDWAQYRAGGELWDGGFSVIETANKGVQLKWHDNNNKYNFIWDINAIPKEHLYDNGTWGKTYLENCPTDATKLILEPKYPKKKEDYIIKKEDPNVPYSNIGKCFYRNNYNSDSPYFSLDNYNRFPTLRQNTTRYSSSEISQFKWPTNSYGGDNRHIWDYSANPKDSTSPGGKYGLVPIIDCPEDRSLINTNY
jgi:hypothetical protein